MDGNWSAKVEYLYYDLGWVQMAAGVTAQFYDGSLGGPPAGLKWLNATQARANYTGNLFALALIMAPLRSSLNIEPLSSPC